MKDPRPAKNRRVSKPRQRKQQHLLEVTVRRDIARVQRNRAIFWFVCKTILVVGLVTGAYLGGKEGLRRYLWENPDYYLTDVRVATDGALDREQILATAGIKEGRNIFTIDLAKAREALDRLPQVERVELQRVLPNRISIHITERKPIAWVAFRADEALTVSDKACLADARGVVMRNKTMLPEYLHLPVISGVKVENLAPGQKVRSYEMRAALELIRLNADNTRFQPRNLDVAKGYCVVVTDQNRRKITFGLDDVAVQVERLMRYLEYSESKAKEIQTVNLLVERNTPIVFAPPPAPVQDESTPPASGKSNPSKDREKSAPPAKKTEPASTPPNPSTKSRAHPSTPAERKRTPVESVKKPFRLHG